MSLVRTYFVYMHILYVHRKHFKFIKHCIPWKYYENINKIKRAGTGECDWSRPQWSTYHDCLRFECFCKAFISLFKRFFSDSRCMHCAPTMKNNKQFIINKANVIKINAKHITWKQELRNAESMMSTIEVATPKFIPLPRQRNTHTHTYYKNTTPSTFILTIFKIISSNIIHSFILRFGDSIQFGCLFFFRQIIAPIFIISCKIWKILFLAITIKSVFWNHSDSLGMRNIRFEGEHEYNLWF